MFPIFITYVDNQTSNLHYTKVFNMIELKSFINYAIANSWVVKEMQ